MSVTRYARVNLAGISLTAHPVHYICTTTAELPVSGLKLGDTALTLDTNLEYKAASTTTWTQSGGSGGGGVTIENRYVTKLTDAPVVGITLAADPDLEINELPANSQWEFAARIRYTAGAGQLQIAFALITGATAEFGQQGAWAGGINLSALGDGGAITLAGTGSANYAAMIRGFVFMGGTPGDLVLRRAQVSASGTTTLRKGSALTAVRQA